MNRAQSAHIAIQDSLDADQETLRPPPAAASTPLDLANLSDVAYDMPGGITVTWAELGNPVPALLLKRPETWTWEDECTAKDIIQSTPEPLPEALVALLFALGDAETARLLRDGATHADLDD
jgi:hypothetical protein